MRLILLNLIVPIYLNSMITLTGKGTRDVFNALLKTKLGLYLAKSDIRQRYRRSTLGPFWITISTAVMVACIGLIFGRLFKSPMQEFLPFITSGLIIWNFISATISDATTVFVNAEAIIKQLPLPLFLHVIRMVARNCYIFFHNILIYPFVCVFVDKSLTLTGFLVLPGFILLVINLMWLSLLISIVCTRFRDMPQIVLSLLQIAFYVTPIIWMPSSLKGKAGTLILDPNPFYHLIEIVRAPLLNVPPSLLNWIVALSLAIVGWMVTLILYNRYKQRISYWL